MSLKTIFTLTLVIFICFYVVGVCGQQCKSIYGKKGGLCLRVDECGGAAYWEICSGHKMACCVTDPSPIPEPSYPLVTKDEFLMIVGDTTRNRELFKYFDKFLKDAGITTKHQVAAFLGQILYESSNLEELEKKPENGGNTEDDARRFIRRGLFYTSGRGAYTWLNGKIDDDLIENPEDLAFPSVAFKAAVWMWTSAYVDLKTGNPVHLNTFSDGSKYNFVYLTFAVRGGTTGLEERLQYWRKAMSVLKTSCPTDGKGEECTSSDGTLGHCALKSHCKAQYVESKGCPLPDIIACCLDQTCEAAIDLAFVMDASGSVGREDFNRARDFVYNVSNAFDIGEERTRVALIRYSEIPEVLFTFNQHSTKSDLLYEINTIYYTGGGTRTDLALQLAHKDLFSSSSTALRDLSRGVSRVLIVMTDGKTNNGRDTVVLPSQVLRKNDSVTIFVMGIGNNVDVLELNAIATDPDDTHVFQLNSFNDLSGFIEQLKESACYEPAVSDVDAEVVTSVGKNGKKYFKLDHENLSTTITVEVEATAGEVDIYASTNDPNPGPQAPGDFKCDWTEVNNRKRRATELCSGAANTSGIIGNVIERGPTKYMYITPCAQNWVYVAVHGVEDKNTFRFFVHNDKIPIPDRDLVGPLKTAVYAGCALALIIALVILVILLIIVCADYRPKDVLKQPDQQAAEEVTVREGKSWVVFIPCCTNVSEKTSLEKDRGLKSPRLQCDNHISQVICLVVFEITFLAGIDSKETQGGCAFCVLVLSYTFLVMFNWLLVKGVSLLSYVKSGLPKVPLFALYCFCWGMPVLPVFILLVDHDNYSSYPGCWVSFGHSSHWAFTFFLLIFAINQLAVLGFTSFRLYKRKDIDQVSPRNGLACASSLSACAILTAVLGISAVNDRFLASQYMFFFSNVALSVLMFIFYVYMNKTEIVPVLRNVAWKCWDRKPQQHDAATVGGGRLNAGQTNDYEEVDEGRRQVQQSKDINRNNNGNTNDDGAGAAKKSTGETSGSSRPGPSKSESSDYQAAYNWGQELNEEGASGSLAGAPSRLPPFKLDSKGQSPRGQLTPLEIRKSSAHTISYR